MTTTDRHHPPSTPTSAPPKHRRDALAELLPSLREQLEGLREFRREQLAQIDLDAAADESVERQQVDAAVAEAALWALDEIEAALARMAAGTYGTCETCGQPIPLERLEVIPHTRYCPPCQLAQKES